MQGVPGKKRLVLVVVGLLLAMMAAGGQVWGAEKTLRFQVNYPGTSYGGECMRYFADQVAKETGGKVEIQLFYAGQILNTKEAFTALQKGMINGMYSALLYYGGVVKEAHWEWLPFTWETSEQALDLFLNQGLMEVMKEAMLQYDVVYLGAIPMGTLCFLTKFPVEKMADFTGKKIRASGPQASTVKLLGGTPVSLAAEEQYTSLQRGTIEGTIYPLYTIGVYKFYEVIDYVVMPGVYSPCVIDLTMNANTWNGLSKELQEAVSRAAVNTMKWTGSQNQKWDEEGLAVTREKKVQITTLSADEAEQLRAATKPMWDEVAGRSALSGKAVGIIVDYMKSKKTGN